ncbi:MAG: hypothetical protein ABEJ02_03885 [Candidatus Paceibacteria bacterium]
MENVKTIKGVDKKTWDKFKEIASKRGLNVGDAFKEMVNDYSKDSDDFWDEILSGKEIISESEAEILRETVKELRKDNGFRE